MPIPRIRRQQRERYPPALFEAADRLLVPDQSGKRPTARFIAEALAAEFEESPTERTVSEWMRKGTIRRVESSEIWSLATARPGEAAFILPVLAALHRPGPVVFLTIDEARVLARLREVALRLPPRGSLEFVRDYLRFPELQPHLDLFVAAWVALMPWELPDGPSRLEEAIAEGSFQPQARYVVDLPRSGDLYAAIQEGINRQSDQTRRTNMSDWEWAERAIGEL